MIARHRRESAVGLLFVALLVALRIAAPAFYSAANIRDILLSNVPVLICAIGSTLVILTGEVDISIGSQLAMLSVLAAGAGQEGLPMPLLIVAVAVAGGLLGGVNGLLVARLGIPSIVVTLATMVAWRETLRWVTEGAWVQDLPPASNGSAWRRAGTGGNLIAIAVSALVAVAGHCGKPGGGTRGVRGTGADREGRATGRHRSARVVFVGIRRAGMLVGMARAGSIRCDSTSARQRRPGPGD